MELSERIKQKLGSVAEWATFYAPLIAMFVFFYHSTEKSHERADASLLAFQRSIDEVHKRCDLLHQEFIEILKEMRN